MAASAWGAPFPCKTRPPETDMYLKAVLAWAVITLGSAVPVFITSSSTAAHAVFGQAVGVAAILAIMTFLLRRRYTVLTALASITAIHVACTSMVGIALLGGVSHNGGLIGVVVALTSTLSTTVGVKHPFSIGLMASLALAVVMVGAVDSSLSSHDTLPPGLNAALAAMSILVSYFSTPDPVIHTTSEFRTDFILAAESETKLQSTSPVLSSFASPVASRPVMSPKTQMLDKAVMTDFLEHHSPLGDDPSRRGSLALSGRSRVRESSMINFSTTARSAVMTMVKPVKWKEGALLGQGGFGQVMLGLNMDTGELMAVKKIKFNTSDKLVREKVRRLQNEIELMKILDHPQIVKYFFTEKSGTSIFIFMEYVPGGSLASLLRTFGPLSEATVVQYTFQILVGLSYLHLNNVVHRDIKGGNILLSTDGCIKLADFGASVICDERVRKDSLQGTPYWMAPEVINQSGHSREADIWSLGCTVLEMLTAKHPWEHLKLHQVKLFQYLVDDSKPVILPGSISTASKLFVLDCVQRNPSLRPSSQQLIEHHYFLEDAEQIATGVLGSSVRVEYEPTPTGNKSPTASPLSGSEEKKLTNYNVPWSNTQSSDDAHPLHPVFSFRKEIGGRTQRLSLSPISAPQTNPRTSVSTEHSPPGSPERVRRPINVDVNRLSLSDSNNVVFSSPRGAFGRCRRGQESMANALNVLTPPASPKKTGAGASANDLRKFLKQQETEKQQMVTALRDTGEGEVKTIEDQSEGSTPRSEPKSGPTPFLVKSLASPVSQPLQ